MKNHFRSTVLAALMIAALPAQAALQSYNFSGTLDSGLSIGQIFSGNFSFDDSSLLSSGQEWLGASSFNINFLGSSYAMSQSAALTEVSFLDGNFLGVSYSYDADFPKFSLIASSGTGESWDVPFLAYSQLDLNGDVLDGAGTIAYQPVPEPESYALLLAALGLLGATRRRAKSA